MLLPHWFTRLYCTIILNKARSRPRRMPRGAKSQTSLINLNFATMARMTLNVASDSFVLRTTPLMFPLLSAACASSNPAIFRRIRIIHSHKSKTKHQLMQYYRCLVAFQGYRFYVPNKRNVLRLHADKAHSTDHKEKPCCQCCALARNALQSQYFTMKVPPYVKPSAIHVIICATSHDLDL